MFTKILLSQMIVIGMCVLIVLGFTFTVSHAEDRFVANADGTVSDKKTGLMWAAKDNGDLISWPKAYSYSKKYDGGGYKDWRMPTLAELKSLYDPGEKNSGGYHMTKLINTTAATCWASDTRGYEAARFNFTYGQAYWLRKSYSGSSRVLPVRSGN